MRILLGGGCDRVVVTKKSISTQSAKILGTFSP